MKLTKIKIKSKYLPEYKIPVNEKFTIIYGENGSGKSTIIKSLLSMVICRHDITYSEIEYCNVHYSDNTCLKYQNVRNNWFIGGYPGGKMKCVKINKNLYQSKNSHPVLQYFDFTKLLDIVNQNLSHDKKILINTDNNFAVKFKNDTLLHSLNSLSTGEYKFFSILYQVYVSPVNNLILMDCPEEDLSIFWQKQFLNILEELSETTNHQFIITTHSPAIINGNWDLTYSLKLNE